MDVNLSGAEAHRPKRRFILLHFICAALANGRPCLIERNQFGLVDLCRLVSMRIGECDSPNEMQRVLTALGWINAFDENTPTD